MLASLLEELPRFLTYHNGLLLLQAMVHDLALSVAGVLGGSVLGGALALARLGRGPRWLAPDGLSPLATWRSSAGSRSW